MTPTLVIVADDLTGAADTGAGFACAGLATRVVWLDTPSADETSRPAHVLAIDTRSRAASEADAARRTTEATSAARSVGARMIYKKIDSMLRGHVPAELAAALSAWHPDAVAIIAPAFPRMGRTTVGGVQHVDGVPVPGPALHERLSQAGISARLADLAAVRGGRLAETMLGRGEGTGAIVCDAQDVADLEAIVSAAWSAAEGAGRDGSWPIVWVGSGGLAPALARRLAEPGRSLRHLPGAAGAGRERAPHSANAVPAAPLPDAAATSATPPAVATITDASPRARPNGPVLIVVGSRSRAAALQVQALAAEGVLVREIPLAALVRRDEPALARDAAPVLDALTRGTDVVVTIGLGDPEMERTAAADAERLSATIGGLLRPAAERVGGLVLTGGDTAVGLLRAWDVRALEIVDEVEPGLPLSIAQGPRAIGVATKAGSFGDARSLDAARRRLAAYDSRLTGGLRGLHGLRGLRCEN